MKALVFTSCLPCKQLVYVGGDRWVCLLNPKRGKYAEVPEPMRQIPEFCKSPNLREVEA